MIFRRRNEPGGIHSRGSDLDRHLQNEREVSRYAIEQIILMYLDWLVTFEMFLIS